MADIRGVAQPGRVLALGARCRRFEPSRPDHDFRFFICLVIMSFISAVLINATWTFALLELIRHIQDKPDKKIEQRKQTQERVAKAINQDDFSVLDYLMDVEHMSERNKVWYEIYKRYGSRNHTWQDFRDMFNDNLVDACKTVRNWKTWDQINALRDEAFRTQIPKLSHLLKKYNIHQINDENYQQFETKYPDLYVTFKTFLTMTYTACPNYCTYNPKVAKLNRKYKGKVQEASECAQFTRKMDKFIDLRNADFVVGERIENYYRILISMPYIVCQMQDETLPVTRKIEIAHKILNKSAEIHGAPMGPVKPGGHPKYYGTYVLATNSIILHKKYLTPLNLWQALYTIIHEDTHRIDYHNPDIGLLGAQIMELVPDMYLYHENELYFKNPVEQTALYIDNIVWTALQQMILQNEK